MDGFFHTSTPKNIGFNMRSAGWRPPGATFRTWPENRLEKQEPGALSLFGSALKLKFSEANTPFPADPAEGQGLQKAFHKGAHTIIVKGQNTV